MRERISMGVPEREAFLAAPHKMSLATVGVDGVPHLVTMYYAPRADEAESSLAFWTYRSSQKARNLARDPRCAVLVEAGEGYDQLRGVSIRGHVREITEPEAVLAIGIAVYGRYVDFDVTQGPILDYLRDQATKRSAYVLVPEQVASWDHRKLAEGN